MKRRGFNLVELLIVVAIMAILVAMLMPAVGGVVALKDATRCRMNLGNLWKAQKSFQADNESAFFADGDYWAFLLLPYLEGDVSSLQCPGSPLYGLRTGTGGTSASPGGDSGNVPPVTEANPQYGLTLNDLRYEIYKSGQHIYDIPLDSDFIFVLPGKENRGPEWKRYEVEDQRTGGDYTSDHKDIVAEVRFKYGAPQEIYFSPQHSGHGYKFKFKIRDKVIFDPAPESGERLELTEEELKEYGLEDIVSSSGAGRISNLVTGGFVYCDYGMSLGSYQILGRRVPQVDSKLYMLCDFPKMTIDFTDGGRDVGDFNKYFIEDIDDIDLEAYEGPDGFEEWPPDRIQSLRHFEKSNVLFCDGHVETLGVDPETPDEAKSGKYLRPNSPLWQFGRN